VTTKEDRRFDLLGRGLEDGQMVETVGLLLQDMVDIENAHHLWQGQGNITSTSPCAEGFLGKLV